MGTQSTWATCVRYINTTNTNTTNKRTNNTMNTMRLSKSVNVASKTVQRSRPAVVAVRAVNLPFGLGGSKTAAPKKTAGGRGSQKVTTSDPAAQSFVIRIPGQFFQSKKDVVWPISLGFTKAITGQGPLAQFSLETGIPLADAEPALLFSIVLLGLTAVNEGTGKFVDDE